MNQFDPSPSPPFSLSIRSIQVGKPRRFAADGDGQDGWVSGIVKAPVTGPIRVGETNLQGDEQADLVHHGGADKAILAYPREHYPAWCDEFPQVAWQDGCFGENLSLDGGTEADVCIGDLYAVGDCLLQVSQPRQPCWKLSRLWRIAKLAVRVQQTRRTGWYLRVQQTGTIAAGDTLTLIERPYPRLTVAFANEVMFAKPRRADDDRRLAACPLLSQSWRTTLATRADRSHQQTAAAEAKRLRPPQD